MFVLNINYRGSSVNTCLSSPPSHCHQIFPNSTVKEASFEGPDVIHAAVLSQTQKILILILREHMNLTVGRINFHTQSGGEEDGHQGIRE